MSGDTRDMLDPVVESDRRQAFKEALAPKTTEELMAMVQAERKREEQVKDQFRKRREETSKEAIQSKIALYRTDEADIEDEPTPTWGTAEEPEAVASVGKDASVVAADEPADVPESSSIPASSNNAPNTYQPAAVSLSAVHQTGSTPGVHRESITQQQDVSLAAAAEASATIEQLRIQVSSLTRDRDSARREQLEARKEADVALGHKEQAVAAAKEAVESMESMSMRLNSVQQAREGMPISKDELQEVRGAIAMQDRIVATLEDDNKRLLETNKALAKRIREFETGAAASEAKDSLKASVTAVPAPSTLEVERLKTVEAELRLELDICKKERVELQRRLDRIDPDKVEAAELQARQTKVELRREKDAHESELRDMARKIAWYVEHQEFNRAQEELIKDQQDELRTLRLKVMDLESLVNRSGAKRTDKDRQIRNLQKRCMELEDAIREQNPNSITELIRACKPSVTETSAHKEHQEKIKKLETQLEEQEVNAQRAIDRLRVESDRVRLTYQEQLSKLEENLKTRLAASQTRKVKDAEKSLSDARRYYGDKLKEQDQIIQALRRGQPTGNSTTERRRAERTAAMKQQDSHPPSQRSRGCQTTATAAAVEKLLDGECLDQELEYLKEANRQLQDQLKIVQGQVIVATRNNAVATDMHSASAASTLQGQLNSAYTELATHKRLLAQATEEQRQTLIHWEERLLKMQSDHQKAQHQMRNEHSEEVIRIQQRHKDELSTITEGTRLSAALHPNVDQRNPKAVHEYLSTVAQHLKSLEQRQMVHAAEAQRMVDEVRRMAQYELAVERQKMELTVQQKNSEIDQFRSQLDSLLKDLAQLQNP